MIAAQEWLNENYSSNQKRNTTELLICHKDYQSNEVFQSEIASRFNYNTTHYLEASKSLTGTLDLSEFTQLKKVMVKRQLIGGLVLTGCRNLEEVYVEDNLLRKIELPQNASRELSVISLVNNNFYSQNLSCFSQLTDLKFLHLGTNNRERIKNNIYNRWSGSLVHLWDLEKLMELDINATDIDSGLEHLPVSGLFYFTCGDLGRKDAGVSRIKELCEFDEEYAISADLGDNLAKVRKVKQVQQELQNQIEVPVNNRVYFRN